MKKMRNIGIMGGTFNPIHNGHILLAKKAYAQFSLDKILFIPAGNPPHKDNAGIIDGRHRLNMVKSAISGIDYFECLDIELAKKTKSYSYETLASLKEMYPDTNLFFIMGADSLFQFESWKNPEEIVKLATLVVARRNGINITSFENQIKRLSKKYSCEILTVDMEDTPISSSDIRMMVANLEPICDIVPSKVCEYILLNDLYRDYKCKIRTTADYHIVTEDLKKVLTEKRYEHTMAVAAVSASLAMRYGYDVFRAYLAGLLHDIAKCKKDSELIDICTYNCIDISEAERALPYLLHGKVAAFIAKKDYYVSNQDILNALTYHTTGRPNMSLLEKIVFVADYIEPYRDKAPNLTYIRKIAFEDINKAVSTILYNTLSYLTSNGTPIDETTKAAYNYYKD